MNLRKQYLVHHRFQWNFACRVFLAIYLPVIICSVIMMLILIRSTRLPFGDLIRMLSAVDFWQGYLLRALPLAFVVGIFSILFSHRIAGPIGKMQRQCRRMSSGYALSRIALRRKDYFQRFAWKLNLLNDVRRKQKNRR
jgi:hypothetical protein